MIQAGGGDDDAGYARSLPVERRESEQKWKQQQAMRDFVEQRGCRVDWRQCEEADELLGVVAGSNASGAVGGVGADLRRPHRLQQVNIPLEQPES